MTQKKFLQIASIVVLSVWVFCATFAIAITIQRKSDTKVPVTNPPATTTTTPALNQQNTLPTNPITQPTYNIPTQPTQPVTDTFSPAPTQPTTQPTTAAPVSTAPQGKEAIVAAYINGVNALKNTPNFTLNKNDTLNIVIDRITGGSMVEGVANTLIPKPTPESYIFIGGVDSSTGKTPNQVIAPLNVPAKVDINAVTNAVSQQNSDGGYTVQLTLKEEQQNLTTPAPNLSTMVQVIDVASLIPSGFELTEVHINYSPSTITATFDSQGRLVSMHHMLVSQGGGGGKMAFISASMEMHGDYLSEYTISYN